jgi:hypothetical protein
MLKHVGRMTKNKRKVVVAYKVVPGDPDSAIVVTTENLSADEHDTLMKLVESPSGQEADELATAMGRTPLPDGSNMLARFHSTGKMVKVLTSEVEMTPNTQTSIKLSELNEVIAEQRGVSVGDLALKGPDGQTVNAEATTNPAVTAEQLATGPTDGVLSDEDLAAQYRSQADAMFKEAKRLREQAEELVPTKKKAKAKSEESA